jgi:cytochrome c oxidase assembly protein Cox11
LTVGTQYVKVRFNSAWDKKVEWYLNAVTAYTARAVEVRPGATVSVIDQAIH